MRPRGALPLGPAAPGTSRSLQPAWRTERSRLAFALLGPGDGVRLPAGSGHRRPSAVSWPPSGFRSSLRLPSPRVQLRPVDVWNGAGWRVRCGSPCPPPPPSPASRGFHKECVGWGERASVKAGKCWPCGTCPSSKLPPNSLGVRGSLGPTPTPAPLPFSLSSRFPGAGGMRLCRGIFIRE